MNASHAFAAEPDFLRARVNGYYYERVEKTWGGGHIMKGLIPGKDAVMLVSNDYLSLASHPSILQAQINALAGLESAPVMSSVFLHGECPQTRFQASMAALIGTEDALLCQSGYAANVGLLQAIAGPKTPIYMDMVAHMSLWEGVKSAGAPVHPFRHNSATHLQQLIARHGPGVVVVDSVYSTNGSVSPLAEITAAAQAGDCVMVVDESHSLGTHGPSGAGLVAELGLGARVHFITASLAKAFAGRAGVIACSHRLTEFLKYSSHPAIFSSALLEHEIAGLQATLELIRHADDRRRRLRRNADYLRARLHKLGYNVDASDAQIIALEAGPEPQTMALRDALEARGVFGSVFCAPATAANRSLIRLSVNATLTLAQLDHVVQTCAAIRDEVDMWNWPSTRRRRQGSSPALRVAA